jgi:CXXX repeat peptide maturase
MIILLDDTSPSFCHYDVDKNERKLIGLDDLRRGIRFAMVENLTIQFVYPDYELPAEYYELINTIDHSDIVPAKLGRDADVVVLDGWEAVPPHEVVAVIRTTLCDLLKHVDTVSDRLACVIRLNIVLTDVEKLVNTDQNAYKAFLSRLGEAIERLYVNGHSPQLNLLTDRMMLTEMNNCGAGETCITLAPNGKFYICPAFYYENEQHCVGDIDTGLAIKNKRLYKLDYAPICRNCDAWQCRRCIWLNRKTTLEVNTPSHQQCVVAHLERNASRELLHRIRQQGTFLPDKPGIPEINYLDPFDNKKVWQ